MDKKLTIVDHLEELRRRIIISLVVLVLTSIYSFPLVPRILRILRAPAFNLIDRLAFFSPQEALMAYIKISIFCGFFLAMPVILYQALAFVSPAIEPRIKKYTNSFIICSFIAFVCGCAFSYYLLLPAMLNFLLSFAKDNLVPVISVDKYISFVVALIIGCGLVFEMPVLSYILTKIGIINPIFLRKKFKYAILAIFIIAAIITPTPDVFNMVILAVPMIFLYEFSIWISKLAGGRKKA